MKKGNILDFEMNLRFKGEIRTPKLISEFISSIIDVKPKAKILDPVCGTGGFLLDIAKKNQKKEINFVGVEINKETLENTKERFRAEGIKIKLISGDSTLPLDGLDENKFDIIVADFPIGKKVQDAKILKKYNLAKKKKSMDTAAILLEKCAKLLEKNGEMVVILPEGFLFSSSLSDIRDYLSKKLSLRCVVSLPFGTYRPFTNIKLSVLLFGKYEKRSDSIYFANAEHISERKNDLVEISKEIKAFKTGATEFSIGFIRPYKEVLNGQRWDVKVHDPKFGIIDEISQKHNYDTKILSDVSEFLSGRRIEKKNKYNVVSGDVLFADKGTIGRPVFITKEKKVYESKTHYIIIRPDKNIVDPLYLFSYLKSKYGYIQIEKHVLGATIPYITRESLASFQVLIPPKSVQEKIAKNYLKLEQVLTEIESTTGQIRSLSEDIFSLEEPLKLADTFSRSESEDILSNLPYPIALGFRKLKHEQLPSRKVNRLLDLFEIILKYTAIIQISILARSSKIEELKRILRTNRIHRAPTDGNWLNILTETSNLLDESIHFEMNIDTSNSEFVSLLEELLSLRNEVRHGATIPEDYASELLSLYEPKIYYLGKFISPLSSFKLRKINVSRKMPDGYEHEILELMGDNPEFEANKIKIKSDLYADFVYLFHNQKNEIIPLTPILVLEKCPLCNNVELFFYDKMENGIPKYVGYRNSHRPTFSKYSQTINNFLSF